MSWMVEGSRWGRMDKAGLKGGKVPPLLFHTLCHPWLLQASPLMSGTCIILLLSSLFLSKSILQLQLCALPFPTPFTPSSPHSSPSPSLFFSLRLKRMHYFQPWLCRVDRESRTMAAFQPHGPALGGHWLLVFFSTVNSNRLMWLAYYWHVWPQR